ncbi:MAG: sulfatase [Acidobacteriia bacterium]|nr:sulfatase [Terriglobia bacterium]MYK10999.1 sulfatase [Terriglobia bacterium]
MSTLTRILLVTAMAQALAWAAPPNVLFIAVDDLNDWTGFLDGHPQAQTPNMDRLASKGVNFRNAHTVAPGCSPSRNALLFGIQPFHSGLYPFYDTDKIDPAILDRYTTLPQLFKESGYDTFASGKIHHGTAWTYGEDGGRREWTEHNAEKIAALPPLVYAPEAGYVQGESRKMAFCPTTSPLEHHRDYATSEFGVDVLKREHRRPFFLAVGFHKPHLPFIAPMRFFDLYQDGIEAPPVKTDDLADVSWPARRNVRLNDDIRYRKEGAWEDVRRAYLASISWTDWNVGRVLDALENSPYSKNTIVVLWSDHGYHLGEKRSFRKFSLWEEATHVPFVIWDTRADAAAGRSTDEAVSLIDIYPTLAEMAGLEAPSYVDGASLVPFLTDATHRRAEPAITTWGRGNYSVRTRDWRYVRYFDGSEELYNHADDPQEWLNLAGDPAMARQKKELAAWLPEREAPLVLSGKALHSVFDADQPDMAEFQQQWNDLKTTVSPPLE